ncbi:MAG: hypothetical protein AB7O26_02355 [Planctomycetaceae bacterium]
MFEIKYEHEKNGTLYVGLISGGTEAAKAVWSNSKGGAADPPREVSLDEDTFSLLWNGISEVAVITSHIVKAKKEAAAADLTANHRISATMKEGKSTTWTFIVPVADESDPEFAKWLAALKIS